jgi:hypothetical protein
MPDPPPPKPPPPPPPPRQQPPPPAQPPPPHPPKKDDDKSTIRIVAISVTAVVLVIGAIVFAVSSLFEGLFDFGEEVIEETTQIAAGSPAAAEGFAEVKIPNSATNVETRVEAGESVDGFKVWISFEVPPRQLEEFLRKERIDGLQAAPAAVLEGLLQDACAGAPASVALCPGWRSATVTDGEGAGRTGQQLVGQLRRPLEMVVVSHESRRNSTVYLKAAL